MADLIAILMAALAGLLKPGVTDAQIEKQLATLLRDQPPAPCASYKVDAEGVSATAVSRITLSFEGLAMDPLLVKSARFEVSKLKLGQDGRLAIGTISWDAVLDQAALTEALSVSQDSIKNPLVEITPDVISISGKYKAPLGARVSFKVDGTLGVEEDTLLMFRIDKTRAAGIDTPKWVSKKVEQAVNPVYDLAKFEKRSKKDIEFAKEKLDYDFKLKVSTIQPGSGKLAVAGSA